MEKILEIEGLRKEFDGNVAVKDLSLVVDRGKITALIGPNGAGKTTVFNLITGFLKPNGGKIFFKNREITKSASYKIASYGIARTFQKIRLFPQITVMENMLLATKDRTGEDILTPLLMRKKILKKDREKEEKALETLKFVGLEHKKSEIAENLSHGQRKLLELSRALATEAQLFLLDEPTAGVFPETKRKIIKIFEKMKSENKTILFIEHNMRIVMDISDRIVVLNHGEKIAEGGPEDVIQNEKVIEAYLGEKSLAP